MLNPRHAVFHVGIRIRCTHVMGGTPWLLLWHFVPAVGAAKFSCSTRMRSTVHMKSRSHNIHASDAKFLEFILPSDI